MQKKLLEDVQTEVAKSIFAFIEDNKIIVNMDGSDFDFDNRETKIKVFEIQIKEWFLKRARHLVTIDKEKGDNSYDNDLIVIMTCTAYIEGVQQYKTGKSSKGKSGKFFRKSLQTIDKHISDDICNNLYGSLRCGLFHNAMIGSNIRICRDFNEMLYEEHGLVTLNPEKLLEAIESDFENYLIKLHNDNATYKKFETMFNFKEQID